MDEGEWVQMITGLNSGILVVLRRLNSGNSNGKLRRT